MALRLSAAMRHDTSSQASTWSQFHAGTDAERHEADFWDDANSGHLRPGEIKVEGIEKEWAPPPGGLPQGYTDYLKRWTCASDDAVVGVPTTSKAILTAHESSIFTDYHVVVTQWLRGGPDPSKSVAVPTAFVVSLDGGRISTGEGTLQVDDDPPLQLLSQFILFLKTIPTTSSYRLIGPALTVGTTTAVLKGGYFHAPPELTQGDKATSAALTDIKSAAGRCGGR
jgi:hypothetical protein